MESGELRIDQDATFAGGVSIDGGLTTVVAGSTLAANVVGAGGAETLAVLGTVNGNVDLGGGNDRLIVGSLAAITGVRAGGDGTDTLEFRTAGTASTPTAFDGTGFDGFENLQVGGGALSLTTSSSWNDVNVTGGSLIAQAGTTLTSAETIDVPRVRRSAPPARLTPTSPCAALCRLGRHSAPWWSTATSPWLRGRACSSR